MAHEFHSIEPEDARVLLFDGETCVLGCFAPRPHRQSHHQILQNLGVELHMGVHVTDVRHDGVTVTPKAAARRGVRGQDRPWTAGVEAVPFARRIAKVLEAKSDHAGRIAVAADLSVPGHPEIFVIGDLVGRDNLPGVAENAMQGGIHAAACVRHDLAGKARPHCRYRDVGSAAYISRGHALLQVGPVKLAGSSAGWAGDSSTSHFSPAWRTASAPSPPGWPPSRAPCRTDRTFILGSTTSPEHPYTWLKLVHPNMIHQEGLRETESVS